MSLESNSDLSAGDKGPVVYAPPGLFEAPAKEFVPGPFYASIEEIMPELAATDPEVKGDYIDTSKGGFSFDRRDLLRMFSAGAVLSASACVRRPAEKAIPYVDQPLDFTPGVANYYATTCQECPAACGVIVKTREGRPVKLEGNPNHPVSRGALCSLGQASIQGLYHPERRKEPLARNGNRLDAMNWDSALQMLGKLVTGTSKVGILTGGSTGNRHGFFKEFLTQIGSSAENLYTYESNGLFSSITEAHRLAFGEGSMPRVELRSTSMVIGINSDFLDVGISPVYFAKQYSSGLGFNSGRMGKLVQFESIASLTGSHADERHVVPVGNDVLVALLLVKALYQNSDSKGSSGEKEIIRAVLDANSSLLNSAYSLLGVEEGVFAQLAKDALSQSSVVLAGGSASFDENATSLQLATIMANVLIGAYGTTLIFDRGWMLPPVKAGDIQRLLTDADQLDVLIIIDTDPLFTLPPALGFKEKMASIKHIVSIQAFPKETDELAHYILPSHHYLEAWGDEQPVSGFHSFRQPAVRATTDSRQAEDILLWLAAYGGKNLPYKDYRTYLKGKWRSIYELVSPMVDYSIFYQNLLRQGLIGKLSTRTVSSMKDIKETVVVKGGKSEGLSLVAPFDHRLFDGRGAHLPILQEIGHGLTTIAWDSWVAINPNTAQRLGLKRNDVVKVEGPNGSFEAAVFPLPGVHKDAVVVPRGNGHTNEASTISKGVGVNPLVAFEAKFDAVTGHAVTIASGVKLVSTGKVYRLAAMQKHADIGNRLDIVKKMSLKTAQERQNKTVDLDTVPDLYPKLEEAEHRWGMAVDLEKCTGCGACMVACSLENNIPQVGRDQILMGREMHWIRLDRYYAGDVDNPEVSFQPVMCQQCNHAPCEAVCPVFATVHDPEGINAMVYNRCVGTRYCANACPYKVRRYNWWTHKWNEIGKREVDRNPRALNPDVTVRTRGVMEKCNFCYGRLRDAKHDAKQWNRPVRDGDAKVACQQTCPTDAIIFGNIKDEKSQIFHARKDQRSYAMLGGDPEHKHYGLKTLPNVSYLADVTIHEPITNHGHSSDHGSTAHDKDHG